MKTRYKYILTIATAWIFLFSAIFLVSNYIFMAGFSLLEHRLAKDNSKRFFHVLLSSTNYIHVLNLDNAYWDASYQFIKDGNPDYIKNNLTTDIFVDNKLNYVIFLNNQKQVVWAKSYNLVEKRYVPIQPEVVDFFQKNAFNFLAHKKNYNDLAHAEHGIASFLTLPGKKDIGYFSLNYIFDSASKKPSKGVLIFGKVITPQYEKELSSKLLYPINIIPLSEFLKSASGRSIYEKLSGENGMYTEALNAKTLIGYKLVKNFNFQPIAVLKIDFPRDVHYENKKITQSHQLILLAFSLLSVFSMSYLVYIFFRRQDLFLRAFEQFVPHKLLNLLRKKSILETSLGDYSEKTISILFMDIRNFTSLSERLTPKESFEFINKILKEVAPVISNHDGFIDKYIGDEIMALFTNESTHADDAVQSAIDILSKLKKLNQSGSLKMEAPVQVGIGINSGKCMLGIIGAEGRLEGTVISDAVNLASRLQTLTKKYEYSVLISKQTYEKLENLEKYNIKYVDVVKVKGKAEETVVYAVIPRDLN